MVQIGEVVIADDKNFEGYERKSKTRDKSSKLDKYKDEIIEKLQIEGIKVKVIYEYFWDKGYHIE